MPLKRICKAPGCTRLCDKDKHYCIEHQALEFKDREKRGAYQTAQHGRWDEMYNSPKWRKLRSEKLRQCPECEICGAPATEVHHIRAHNGDWGLFLDSYNLLSICHACHLKETQRESVERKRQKAEAKRKLWY